MNTTPDIAESRRRRNVRIALAMVVVGVVLTVAFGQYAVYGVIPLVVGGVLMYQRSAKKPPNWWQLVLGLLALCAAAYIVILLGVLSYRYVRS